MEGSSMKSQWVKFYIQISIFFSTYYLLNSYIHYSFVLNMEVITILLVVVILFSLIFFLKKYSVNLYGLIISVVCLLFLFIEIIQIYILASKNIGESGFGIFEILSLIPLVAQNLVYLFYNGHKYKKLNSTPSVPGESRNKAF